jgi:Flp pilus assembly protein TadG
MLAFANIDHAGKRWRDSDSSGQSLVEVAVIVPILFLLIAYAVDYGYFFLVAAQLTSASRVAAEYSIQGFQGPAQTQLPAAGPISTTASVAALAVGDLAGLLNSSTTTTVQVCSRVLGMNGNGNVPNCSNYGPSGTSYTPATDPKAPIFVLHRVDVTYTVNPPVPLSFFSFSLIPTLQFHRQVSMRAAD